MLGDSCSYAPPPAYRSASSDGIPTPALKQQLAGGARESTTAVEPGDSGAHAADLGSPYKVLIELSDDTAVDRLQVHVQLDTRGDDAGLANDR